jgi:cysteine-rich repeat protein
LSLSSSPPAQAGLGDCGQPASIGMRSTASDALFVLAAATGLRRCKLCVCDVDGNGSVRAADALALLYASVGIGSTPVCGTPCEPLCLDGIVDPGEECDDGAESAYCDANCTLARCGDGTLNQTRGEECDTHGRSASCDADCTFAICGDRTVNKSAGETCDDGNAIDGDGCDSNCTLTACGNGIVTVGEECDDAGASATCDADCTFAVCGDGVRNAVAGEECDDAGPSATCDADCTFAVCGDGVVNAAAGEQCEDGNAIDGDGCDSNCTLTACGNGIVTVGEECDDTGPSATCDADCTFAVCGDGVVNAAAGEQCEDGNAIDGDGCDSNCTLTACGNGIVTAGEECDDAGPSATCDADCTFALCGDGVLNVAAGEDCDDGAPSATCDADCTPVVCGDAVVNTAAGEECEDGNAIDGDGCDSNCTLTACGNGIVTAGEECDDAGASATCDADCTRVVCGDGVVNTAAGEECEDGNTIDGDGCDSNCKLTACGNGIVTAGEQCDDAGPSPTCDADCTWAVCGDGTKNTAAGEQCDRGDDVDGDGCDTNCTFTGCGNGIMTAGEECDDAGESATCDIDCTRPMCGDGIANLSAGEACDGEGDTFACDRDCTVPVCGDGYLNALVGEVCDDGNDVAGDGCEPDCRPTPACGNGHLDVGEACDDGNVVAGDGCSTECHREACEEVDGEVRCLACPPGWTPDESLAACTCAPGFEEIDGDCIDVDECALGVAACADPQRCVNVPGSYSCAIDCTVEAFHAALASCGAPTGVITFACTDTNILVPPSSNRHVRTTHCDDLVIDGLDRHVTFEMSPACFEIPVPVEKCAGPLALDGTCACPAIDNGEGFLLLRGDRNVVRNLTIRHFYEGVHASGRLNTVENVDFVRICDDAVGNLAGGVGNVFTDLRVSGGCDKCAQSSGDLALTAADPRLTSHYNAVFRDVSFLGCEQPLRMTAGGRYLVERVTMRPDENGFGCTGPRFTSTAAKPMVVDMRDSLVFGCRRGVRLGGNVSARIQGSTIVGSAMRGVLVTNSARARLWDNLVAENGGVASSEQGFGGIAMTQGGVVDAGGGSVEIEGDATPSPGRNVVCNNFAPAGKRRDFDNRTDTTAAASANYWCTLEPAARLFGAVEHAPFLDVAP